jgi:outer membrane protein TolC
MLMTVVQRALNKNLDLDAALAQVRQARGTASGAGAQLLPTIDFAASRSRDAPSADESPLLKQLASKADSLLMLRVPC